MLRQGKRVLASDSEEESSSSQSENDGSRPQASDAKVVGPPRTHSDVFDTNLRLYVAGQPKHVANRRAASWQAQPMSACVKFFSCWISRWN